MITKMKDRAFIQQFEGFAKLRADGLVEAYPDPATGGDPWTIGWGSTGPDIGQGTVWTREQCEERFNEHLAQFEQGVSDLVKDNATQGQFDAMVSFAYNLGIGSLRRSTLLRKHNEGDYTGAAKEFPKWCRAGGKVLRGLQKRRAAEAELYLS